MSVDIYTFDLLWSQTLYIILCLAKLHRVGIVAKATTPSTVNHNRDIITAKYNEVGCHITKQILLRFSP